MVRRLTEKSMDFSSPEDNFPAATIDNIEIETNTTTNTWRNPINRDSDRQYNRRRCKPPKNSSFNCIEFIRSKLFLSIIIVSAVIITLLCIGIVVLYDQTDDVEFSAEEWKRNLSDEQAIWYESGLNELKHALRIQLNKKRARNVILFVGDGMGPNTVTASRIYKYGEDGNLSWERFPHMGLLKTYCADKQVPDSTATATALFGGVKANFHTSGVDSNVPESDCEASMNSNHHVSSILAWAQDVGMSTGFVTTTRVVHATPAALYSHTPDRHWECESKMPEEAIKAGCKDIARQLIEDLPGRNINVIMGGGRQCLVSNVTDTQSDPIDTWSCVAKDGRNLIHKWADDKRTRRLPFAVVQNNGELAKLADDNAAEYVLGIFANGHLMYDHERNTGPQGMPSLREMTDRAIQILDRNPKGYVLVVEGGMIDQAHHRGWARRALSETAAMDEAVGSALELVKHKADETLFIVTSDHAHSLSINGYPKRGNDILGVAHKSKADDIPYTTLTYATGHYGYQVNVDDDGKATRKDPSTENTTAYDYVQQVAIFTDENAHAGNDVLVYATGPMAHLFHKVHEQSYVAHVISYAAHIGRFRDSKTVHSFMESLGVN